MTQNQKLEEYLTQNQNNHIHQRKMPQTQKLTKSLMKIWTTKEAKGSLRQPMQELRILSIIILTLDPHLQIIQNQIHLMLNDRLGLEALEVKM